MLRPCVWDILELRADKLDFEDLYRRAYQIVLHKQGVLLQERLHDTLEEWLDERVRPKVLPLATVLFEDKMHPLSNGASYCSKTARAASQKLSLELTRIWAQFSLSVAMLSDIFNYMVCFAIHSALVIRAQSA